MDRAIREIIQPVVERSVTIACITTRELVTKDLAMEPDAKKVSNAAHLMVSNLAGSLALVTCKQPLRVSMGNHLRSLLSQMTSEQSQSLVDQVVSVCPDENLELGCMLIEKAATEKAMRDIDEALESAIMARVNEKPFYDMSIFATGGRYPNALPDHLRPTPNPNGLSPQHLRVYEAFQRQRMPRQPVAHGQQSSAQAQGGLRPGPAHGAASSGDGSASGGTLSAAQAIEKWRIYIATLDRQVQEMIKKGMKGGLSRLPADSEMLLILHEIRNTGLSIVAAQRDEAVIGFAQRVFKRLYELSMNDANDIFRLEVQFAVLEIFADICKELRKKISSWIMFAPIEQRFNRLIAFGFVKTKLVAIPEFDRYLAKLLEIESDGQGQGQVQVNHVVFAIDIVSHCIVSNRLLNVSQMLNTLDALQKIAILQAQQKDIKFPTLNMLLDEVRAIASSTKKAQQGQAQGQGQGQAQAQARAQGVPAGVFLRSNDPSALRQQVAKLLNTWIQICSKSDGSAEKQAHAPYLSLLQQQGALKGDENADRFFRITTELCVESSLTATGKSLLSHYRKPKVWCDMNGNRWR